MLVLRCPVEHIYCLRSKYEINMLWDTISSRCINTHLTFPSYNNRLSIHSQTMLLSCGEDMK